MPKHMQLEMEKAHILSHVIHAIPKNATYIYYRAVTVLFFYQEQHCWEVFPSLAP